MKLDFNFDFIGLDDQIFEGNNAGKMLANALASSSKGDALKFWDWAKKLFKGEALDLDKSDQETLKSFVKESESFTVLAKAQILEIFLKD
jgi:hypothetical protein